MCAVLARFAAFKLKVEQLELSFISFTMPLIPEDEKAHSNEQIERIYREDGIRALRTAPNYNGDKAIEGQVEKGVIQFYFSLSGNFTFLFGPHYELELKEGRSFFFYNPEKEMKFRIKAEGHARLVGIFITIEKLHSLFLEGTEELSFLAKDNANQKLYQEMGIKPGIAISLNQLYQHQLSENAARIFYKAKTLEILSLFFSKRTPDTEVCPFLSDEENVQKIRKAKNLLIDDLLTPPTIARLSELVELNEHKLKSGFKEIYGNTIGGYLLDYKLEKARLMLDTGKYQVNEVAFAVGYQNPSHFIASFKKKYQLTPKKYIQRES